LYQPYTPPDPTIPDTAPSTRTVEIHPNTHKGHKTQQPPYLFPHPLLFLTLFSATFINYPNFYIYPKTITSPTPTLYRYYHQGSLYVIGK
jgi:hypothetical protein